jgi:hypothetical protein
MAWINTLRHASVIPRVTRASALIDDAQEKGVHVIVAEKLC